MTHKVWHIIAMSLLCLGEPTMLIGLWGMLTRKNYYPHLLSSYLIVVIGYIIVMTAVVIGLVFHV